MANDKKKLRRYRKSTPLGRLRRNVDKAARHAELLKARLLSWGSDNGRLVTVAEWADDVIDRAYEMNQILMSLEDERFVPPERPRTVVYVPGQRVAVAEKYRDKYEQAFKEVLKSDPKFLDDLVVEDVLCSKEIVVRRGKKTPFMVSKTHLVLVGEPDE